MADLPPDAAIPRPRTEAESRAARLYLAILLPAALAIGLGLAFFGWRLGPPEGDLARIGGYSERAFGWRGEVQGLPAHRYDQVTLEALLDGAPPGELLVFGDSFSLLRENGISWINDLQAPTGLETRFVRIDDFRAPLRYLTSDAFLRNPPRAVVVESVERELAQRALGIADPAAPCTAPPPPAAVRAEPAAPPETVLVRRRTAFEGMDELFSWGALAARLRLTGRGGVVEVGLTRDDLFSHAASDRALLLGYDVELHLPDVFAPFSPEQAAQGVVCGLRRLATAARDVPFRLAIAPDKRSAYAPWIATPLPPKALDRFALAREALGETYVDLLTPLRAAAEAGVRDLYWPDDTHWGAAGHRLAGETTARALTGTTAGDAFGR